MDFGKVLGRAWEITWRWKMLWVLGFLAALGQGGGSYPQLNYTYSGQDFDRWLIQPGGFGEEILGAIAAIAIVLCCVAVIFGIILWVISVIARGGLIAGVQQVELEGETSFGRAWRAGTRKFWTLFGLGFLAALPMIAFMLIGFILFTVWIASGVNLMDMGDEAAFAGLSIVSLLCLGFLCCGLIPAYLVFEQIRTYGERAAILEDLGWIDAFKRGWRVLVENIGATLILWLIFLALGLVIGVIIFAVLAALMIPMFGWMFTSDPGWQLLGPLCIGGVVGTIVFAVFRSIIMAYTSSTWTLAYMELTKDDEHPQLGNLELIEEA